jgi:sec-independent protein translocase protein TatA
MDFSIWQIAIVAVIALIVFGPKRLPELGRSLGSGMREFKESITGKSDDEERKRAEKREIESAESGEGGERVEGEVVTQNRP